MALDNARTSSAQAPCRILTYADSTQSFGAESVFCDVVRTLSGLPQFHVTAAVPAENRILWDAVHDTQSAEVIDVPGHPAKGVPFGVWHPRRGAAIRTALAKDRYEVMFVNLPSVEYGAAPLVWARRASAASIGIMHLHHRIGATSSERPLAGLRDRLAGAILRGLDHALVISPSGPQAVAQDWGLPIESCSVLPLLARRPVPLDGAASRQRLGLPGEAALVGMLGRIDVGQKGHDVFVRAAARMVRNHPGIGFVIAGEGPDEPLVRRLIAQEGLSDHFHFLGTVRPPDVVLGALDAIAFPSRFEGLPLTAIEALSVGLPGVASRVDGLAVVWPSRWTVEPDDPVNLARTLEEVLGRGPSETEAIVASAAGQAQRWLTDDLGPVLTALLRRVLSAKARTAQSAAGGVQD